MNTMNYRIKKTISILALFVAAIPILFGTEKGKKMKYELKPLPYSYEALEPYIDAETVKLHHDKHQAAYVAKLNAALESAPEFDAPECMRKLLSNLSDVPEKIRNAVRNNGGGAFNHVFYWEGLSPDKTEPCAEFKEAIERDFGSVEKFKEEMSNAAVNRFGSGWAWLVLTKEGKLKVVATPNQDCPVMGEIANTCGSTPIFCIDVWEHAYYLKYKNLRPEYVKNIWNIVNWQELCKRYKETLKK